MRLDDLINRELGRYRVEALIGRGGMAAVYRAFDMRLRRYVALKVLYPQYLADPDVRERFAREAITAAQLDHPNIVPIYDVGESDELVYLAMKLLPGPSLADLLLRERRITLDRMIPITREVAAALDEAHRRGIIHRDIKPGNVLFDERGHALLTDFGIAKSLDAPALTESSVIVGTPDYIAPEQIDPRLALGGRADHRADIYALGALLYRALTGRRPFEGPTQAVLVAHLQQAPAPPSTVAPDLPPGVDRVILRALAKHPDDRYPSAGDLADALSVSAGDATEVGAIFPPAAIRRDPHTRATTDVRLPQPAGHAARPTPGRGRLAGAIVALVLLLTLGGGLFALIARSDQPSPAAADKIQPPIATLTSTPTVTHAPPMMTHTPTDAPSATPTDQPTTTPTDSPLPTLTQASLVSRPPAAPPTTPPARPTQLPVIVPPPVPTQAPTIAPTSAPTAAPTIVPTDAPVASCSVALAGGFGYLWRTNTTVREALGCPLEEEQAGLSVEQLFEGGQMYWREAGHQHWVMQGGATGSWRRYTDVPASDPDPTDSPPPSYFMPAGGFGKLWQKYPAIRASMGWATTPEVPFTGVIQRFERGTLLFAPAINGHGKRIYALYNNGTFAIFRDEYAGP